MSALAAVAVLAAACGTQKIKVPKTDASLYRGAVLFSQRCSGCHTLSYAATNGSAPNPRTALITNGPNLDQRCERPVTRVLYAIANGGFSGAIMPQNVVVGQDAVDVAEFVSKYAGTHAATTLGVTPCQQQPIGTIPTAAAARCSGRDDDDDRGARHHNSHGVHEPEIEGPRQGQVLRLVGGRRFSTSG